MMKTQRFSVFDGLFRRNAVLAEGMVIAPIVVCCSTLRNALMLSLAFACITFLTVCIGAFYPKRLPYALKITLYALTACVCYLPAVMLCRHLDPQATAAIGIYLPLLTVNSFIVLHSQLHFYPLRKRVMLPVLLFHIAGFAAAAVIVGVIRELVAFGTVYGHVVDMPLLMQGFSAPWAGFILLGLLCALHRAIFPQK